MIKNNLPWVMSYCHLECEMSAVFEEDELLQDLGVVYENIETEGQNLVEWSPVGSVKESQPATRENDMWGTPLYSHSE